MRYLGELYCEKVVDSRLVFDMLYKIVGYGHERDTPRPDIINPLDLPDDFFRIRLVCTLLEVLGDLVDVFDRGPAKKKLDFFLTFFQYYITTKDPVPMDTEFLIQDTFYKIRPQWKLLNNFEEARAAFAELTQVTYQKTPGTAAEEEIDDESASEDESDAKNLRNKEEVDKSSGEEADDAVNGAESPELASEDDVEEEEEHIIVTRPEDERDPEIDADFDRELAKMMAESVESRKFERKQLFDVPLPMRRRVENGAAPPEDVNITPNNDRPVLPAPSTMKFSLLSKKGNRQQTRSIDLPADSTFAVAMKSQQQAETEEKQRIKNLVLNYDLSSAENESEGEYGSFPFDSNSPYPPLERNENGLYGLPRGSGYQRGRQKKGGAATQAQPQTQSKSNGASLARHLHSLRAVGRKGSDNFNTRQNAGNNNASSFKSSKQNKSDQTPAATSARQTTTPSQHKKTDNKNTFAYDNVRDDTGIEPKQPQNPYNAPRIDKAGNSARMQRGRKLQLSDMDW